MTSRRAAFLVVVCWLVVAGGCSSQQVGTESGQPDADREFVVGPTSPVLAAVGADLIALDTNSLSRPGHLDQPLAMGQTRPGGEWEPLPTPDERFGLVALASAGQSVVLAGASCKDEECNRGIVEFYRLAEDRKSWDQLGDGIRYETGLAEIGAGEGQHDSAYFSTPAGAFIVADTGVPVEVPPDASGVAPGYPCIVESTAVSVEVSGPLVENPAGPEDHVVTSVRALDLNDPESGWKERSKPDVVLTNSSSVCGPNGQLFVQGGVETAYDASSDRWTSRPVAVPSETMIISLPATSAIRADGTLFVLGSGGGPVWSRSPDGDWVQQDAVAAALISSDKTVLVAPPSNTTLTFTPLED